MCPNCPRCNYKGGGCSNIFGSHMRAGGGVLGACVALGRATEHRGYVWYTTRNHAEIRRWEIYVRAMVAISGMDAF
eukprot:9835950-Karenia_brevis.AAC.1